MKIKSILVSQPAPVIAEKSPFNEIVLKHKIKVTFRPFIKLEGVSLKEFRSQRVDILSHSAVIFTSRVTIDNFFRIAEEARITIPEGMKYFCNTEAVALYLQKYIVYRKRKIFFADGSFANFMDLILKHKDESFLLTLSEPHKPELSLGMAKLALKFEKVILARTVSADLDDLDIKSYDMLVFYSPSEIASLISKFSVNGSPKIATFGHGTTKAALDEGLTISVMAPTPEVPSMTKAIDLYIAKIGAGEEVSPIVLKEESPDLAYIQAQQAKPSRRKPVAAAKKACAKSCVKSVAKGSSKVAVKSKSTAVKSAVSKGTKNGTKTTAQPDKTKA